MENEQDYYRLLGVPREAPDREVKRAYYELARLLHPDKAKDPEEAQRNASELALISKAYNTLKDAKKRAEYDAQIKGRPAAPTTPAPAPPANRPNLPATSGAKPPTPTAAAAPAQPASAVAPSQGDMLAMRRTMAQKAFVRGMQLYRKQELKDALGFFEAAVTNDPESEPQYHLKYAQTLMKLGRSFTKAVEHAENAVRMDPYNVEFKLALAEINEMAGVTTRARELYEDVIKWDAANETAKMRLGLLKAEEDSKKSALDKFLGSIFKKKSGSKS